jgi:hypothetical protein
MVRTITLLQKIVPVRLQREDIGLERGQIAGRALQGLENADQLVVRQVLGLSDQYAAFFRVFLRLEKVFFPRFQFRALFLDHGGTIGRRAGLGGQVEILPQLVTVGLGRIDHLFLVRDLVLERIGTFGASVLLLVVPHRLVSIDHGIGDIGCFLGVFTARRDINEVRPVRKDDREDAVHVGQRILIGNGV